MQSTDFYLILSLHNLWKIIQKKRKIKHEKFCFQLIERVIAQEWKKFQEQNERAYLRDMKDVDARIHAMIEDVLQEFQNLQIQGRELKFNELIELFTSSVLKSIQGKKKFYYYASDILISVLFNVISRIKRRSILRRHSSI